MISVNEKLTAIADPIRSLMKEKQPLTLDDMANRAEQLTATNADLGSVLYGTDFGGKSQYDEFWDAIQYNGNKEDYIGTFLGRGWNDTVFKPKYNIVPTNAYRMFSTDKAYSYAGGIQDLYTCIQNAGVTLDFSKCGNFQMTWYHSIVTHIGVIDTTRASDISQTFYFAKYLHTIDELILKNDGSQKFSYDPFKECLALENIKITGQIGVTVAFAQSLNLTHESLMSIINALKDYSGTTSTYTLTLHTDAKARLSDTEKAIITQKGWTLA